MSGAQSSSVVIGRGIAPRGSRDVFAEDDLGDAQGSSTEVWRDNDRSICRDDAVDVCGES
jgi:hypothetical protein